MEVGGRLKREEIYIYIYIYCSIAETNTAGQSNYPAIKKKLTMFDKNTVQYVQYVNCV